MVEYEKLNNFDNDGHMPVLPHYFLNVHSAQS